MHARFGKKSGIFVVVKWTKFAPEFGVEKSVLNQLNIFFLKCPQEHPQHPLAERREQLTQPAIWS